MKDHENAIVKKLEEKHEKLREENCRLEDDVIRKASLPDKVHAYFTMLAVAAIIFFPIYTVLQLIQLPQEIRTYVTMWGSTMVVLYPI